MQISHTNTAPETGTKNSEIPALSERDIRRNMIFVILLDAISGMGTTDIGIAMAPMWIYLGASNSLIGFTQSLGFVGLISVALIPFLSRRFRYKKWLLFGAQIPYVGVWGLIGLALIFGPGIGMDKSSILKFCIILSVMQMFLGGFTGVPHQEYVAACIPMSHRGRFTGYSWAIGAVLGLGVAYAGKIMLDQLQKPASIGMLFIISWFICQFGYVFALFGKERPVPTEDVPTPWSRKMLAAAWHDKEYMWVIVIWDLFLAFYWPALFTFMPIYGIRNLGMAFSLSAVFMIIRSIISIVGAPSIGYLTDRFSAKRMFIFWTIVASINFVPLIALRNSIGVYIAMVGGAIVVTGLTTAGNTLMYGLPKSKDRTGHYSIQQLMQSVCSTFGPLLVGRMCDISFPYALTGVTLVAVGLSVASMKMLAGLSENPLDYE